MEKDEFENLNQQIKKQIRISLKALEDAKRMIEEVEINMNDNQKKEMNVTKNLLGSNIRIVGTWPS